MKKLLLISLCISRLAFGQGKYFGGSGDGFAVSEAAIILPVQLLSFRVVSENGHAQVQWEAVTANTSYFTIEISSNGFIFDSLSGIPAFDDPNLAFHYFYDDISRTGTWFYRLSWTAISGQIKHSAIISYSRPGTVDNKVFVYYDPAAAILYIRRPAAFLTIEIYSPAGQLRKKLHCLSGHCAIPATGFSTGVYIVKISDGNKVTVYRFVKS